MSNLATAQQAGTIKYKENIKMHFEVDSATKAMMGDMMPPMEHSNPKLLYFNADHALYQNGAKPEEANSLANEADGNRVVIKMDVPDNKVYSDLKNNQQTQLNDFMGRKFLVATDPPKSDWKLTGKQKTILTYPCQQAQRFSTNREGKPDTLTAWFTTSIPVSLGPDGQGGLPGMILELTRDNGNHSVVAESVDLTAPDDKLIKKPKDGKKVTKEEYDKIVAEKTKEMQEQYGGRGNMIIKIDHN